MAKFRFSASTMSILQKEMQSARTVLAKWSDVVADAVQQVKDIKEPPEQTMNAPTDIVTVLSRSMTNKELSNFMLLNRSVRETVKKEHPQWRLFDEIIAQIENILDDKDSKKPERLLDIIQLYSANKLVTNRMKESMHLIGSILEDPFPGILVGKPLDRKNPFERLLIKAFILGLDGWRVVEPSYIQRSYGEPKYDIPYMIEVKNIQTDQALKDSITKKIESIISVRNRQHTYKYLIVDNYFAEKYNANIIRELRKLNPAERDDRKILIQVALTQTSFKPYAHKVLLAYMTEIEKSSSAEYNEMMLIYKGDAEKITPYYEDVARTEDKRPHFKPALALIWELKTNVPDIFEEVPELKLKAFKFLLKRNNSQTMQFTHEFEKLAKLAHRTLYIEDEYSANVDFAKMLKYFRDILNTTKPSPSRPRSSRVVPLIA
jgi:hypothetical protein